MENEKRLIDANALVNTLMSTIIDFHQVDRMNVAIKYVVTAPTVDAVEVVHGRWVEHRPNVYECTACHTWYGNYGGNEEWNYCPNCGAKMDGEEKDSNLLFADMEEIIDA